MKLDKREKQYYKYAYQQHFTGNNGKTKNL